MNAKITKMNRIGIVFILILLVSFFSGCIDTPEDNQPKTDFTFTTLEGVQQNLSDFYGKIILVDLMAVNCQPCMYQMFELKKISENYSHDDVAILSIDVWIRLGETPELLLEYINAFQQQVNITLDWTFGVDDTVGSIEQIYAKNGVPTLYIFDTNGNIYYTKVGYEPYSTLKGKLDELLNS